MSIALPVFIESYINVKFDLFYPYFVKWTEESM